jgi:hypothetical protein
MFMKSSGYVTDPHSGSRKASEPRADGHHVHCRHVERVSGDMLCGWRGLFLRTIERAEQNDLDVGKTGGENRGPSRDVPFFIRVNHEQETGAMDGGCALLRLRRPCSVAPGWHSRALVVNIGETVAASLSSPVLNTIANDMSKMQVLTTVDESDIEMISIGETSSFRVEAHPDRKFSGIVSQIRLASVSSQNMIN